ncbi:amidohydrolase family protein [Kineosporia sp. A_224]|uniref:amidohydrolase family protein n=1 Tax=Kineosporia sp. A_224 TaxID=1962180 RepID=UPI000B4C1729|nr:amidohydrolase family protein [Kineosporia sp. A_224]
MALRLPAILADHRPASGMAALVGARLFDGTGSGVGGPVTVVLRDGRIERVQDVAEPVPADVPGLDLAGRYLMPGLVDVHTHLSILEHVDSFPRPEHGAEPLLPNLTGHIVAQTLRRSLRMGVTTVRDVGAYGDTVLEARQAMRYEVFAGPRLYACGRIVSATAPGGRFFDGMYREADGPDDLRRAVREQFRRGADFIKLMTTGARSVEIEDPDPAQLTPPEVAAVVDEAHRLGYRVAAHCEGLAGSELAILAGADSIEHGMYLHRRPDLLDAMARQGQVLVPTLTFLHAVAENGTWTPELVEQGKFNVEEAHETLQAAHRAGVTIALGQDGPAPERAADELVRLIEHGLPSTDALRAATLGGAVALGAEDLLGTVRPGRWADLVVLDADPVQQPHALQDPDRIRLVLRNGVPVAGADLDPPHLGI